jgi:hypothetical protein
MNACAVKGVPRGQGLAVGVQAPVRREEGWMDVQEREGAGLEEGWAEHAHEACAEHEIRGRGADPVRQGFVKGRPR